MGIYHNLSTCVLAVRYHKLSYIVVSLVNVFDKIDSVIISLNNFTAILFWTVATN